MGLRDSTHNAMSNHTRIGAIAAVLAAISLCLTLLLIPVTASAAPAFPDEIPLPNGFQPEGIVVGHGTDFYAGSLVDGAIYKGDLRTGEGQILVPSAEGKVAVGLAFDERTGYVYVAGDGTGMAWIYDGDTGEQVAALSFADPAGISTFVNDVVVTRDAAYFTDSSRPVLYRVALDKGGEVPDSPAATEITLGGDFAFTPGQFNANGIEATSNGKWLIVVNSFAGELYLVEATTDASVDAMKIDLGGDDVSSGDGILLHGKTLYVVQNFLNQIAVMRLGSDRLSGEIVRTITDADFDVPTTIDRFGSSLYAVNARFGTTPTPDTEYWITKVPRP